MTEDQYNNYLKNSHFYVQLLKYENLLLDWKSLAFGLSNNTNDFTPRNMITFRFSLLNNAQYQQFMNLKQKIWECYENKDFRYFRYFIVQQDCM